MASQYILLPATTANFSTLDWQNSVINATRVTSVGLTPTIGDRYIIAGVGGAWSTFTINDIVEYTAGGWTNLTPNEGFAAWNETTNNIYVFNGTTWSALTGGIAPIGTSTDSAIVRWDGVAGAALDNSLLTIADTTGLLTNLYAGSFRIDSSAVDGATAIAFKLNSINTFVDSASILLSVQNNTSSVCEIDWDGTVWSAADIVAANGLYAQAGGANITGDITGTGKLSLVFVEFASKYANYSTEAFTSGLEFVLDRGFSAPTSEFRIQRGDFGYGYLYATALPTEIARITTGSSKFYNDIEVGVAGVRAVGLMTFTDIPTVGQTFVVDGTTHTIVAGPTVGSNQVEVGTDAATQGDNVARDFNAHSVKSYKVYAVSDLAGLVKFISVVPGVVGNAITFTEALDNCSVNGGGFLGGTTLGAADSVSLSIDSATGDITTSGTVDGKDVSTLGTGDVSGPVSSVDNQIVRFDLATGKVIQTSLGSITDLGALSGLPYALKNIQDDIAVDGTPYYFPLNDTTPNTSVTNSLTTKTLTRVGAGLLSAKTDFYFNNSGKGVGFDGVNYLSGDVLDAATGTQDFYIECDFKATGMTTFQGICSFGDGTDQNMVSLMFYSTTVELDLCVGGAYKYASWTIPVGWFLDNVQHRLLITIDRDDAANRKCYIDGVALPVKLVDSISDYSATAIPGTLLRIGNTVLGGAPSGNFVGTISEFKLVLGAWSGSTTSAFKSRGMSVEDVSISQGNITSSTLTAKSITLDRDATDGGALYFNSATTSFLKSSTDGLTLSGAGFTTYDFITSAAATLKANQLQSKVSPVYNVKLWGALGDGATDDYTALNTCLSAIKTAGGGVMYFPAGDYHIGTALDFDKTTYSNIHVIGDGNVSILNFTTGGSHGIVGLGAYGSVQDIQIKTASGTAIYNFGVCTRFKNIYISGGATGFNAFPNAGHVVVENIITANLTAQTLDFGGSLNIVRNWWNTTATSGYGVYFRGSQCILENFHDTLSTVSAIGIVGTQYSQIINPVINQNGGVYAIKNLGAGTSNILSGYALSLADIEDPLAFSLISGSTINILGNTSKSFQSLTLDNGITHGGMIGFNASITSKIQSSNDGKQLEISGFENTKISTSQTVGRTDASLAMAIATANALRTILLAHYADGAEHFHSGGATPDTVNGASLTAIPAATTLATLITLITGEQDTYTLHDTDAKAATPTYHNAQYVGSDLALGHPTTLATCIAAIDELIVRYSTDAGSHDKDTTAHTTGNTHGITTALLYKYSSTPTDYIIAVTDTSKAVNVDLSTADVADGRTIKIKDESGGAAAMNITVSTQASELIDGASTATISQNYGSITTYSNGTDWFIS